MQLPSRPADSQANPIASQWIYKDKKDKGLIRGGASDGGSYHLKLCKWTITQLDPRFWKTSHPWTSLSQPKVRSIKLGLLVWSLEDQIIVLRNKYELTAAERRCPLREETANETIVVLAQGWMAWSHHSSRKGLRLIWTPRGECRDRRQEGPQAQEILHSWRWGPILAAWPNLEFKMIEILGDNLWFANWATSPRNRWGRSQ